MTDAAIPEAAALTDRLERHIAEVVVCGSAGVGALGVIVNGRPVLLRRGDPSPSENTTFEIGSVTKTLTALLLAELARTGDVRLHDPISAYLPLAAVPRKASAAAVTLEQLATHTSGLPPLPANFDFPNDPQRWRNPYSDYHLDDLYRATATLELIAEPGAQVAYSNFGIGLLGQLLANAAGHDYAELLVERICRPLGMTDTAAAPGLDTPTGHDLDGHPTPPFAIPGLAGSGVLRCSPGDLLCYVGALLNPESSPLAFSLRLVQTPRRVAEGRQSIGLVWNHRRFRFGDLIFHGGATAGFMTFVGFSPSASSAVFALRNGAQSDDNAFVQETYELLKFIAKERAVPKG